MRANKLETAVRSMPFARVHLILSCTKVQVAMLFTLPNRGTCACVCVARKKRKLSWVYMFAFACLSCKSLGLDYSVIGCLITPVGSFILLSICTRDGTYMLHMYMYIPRCRSLCYLHNQGPKAPGNNIGTVCTILQPSVIYMYMTSKQRQDIHPGQLSLFSKKKLPWVRFEPTTLHVLGVCSTN